MTTTKTVTLDFGVTDVTATITFEDESPWKPCARPAADWMAVVNDDVSAREANESGWWWDCMNDDAARMWDFK